MDAANNPPMIINERPVQPVLSTIPNIPPLQSYDGDMFLRDRPVHLDPDQLRVGIPVRFIGDENFIPQPPPIRLQPNPLYNPTLPIQ